MRPDVTRDMFSFAMCVSMNAHSDQYRLLMFRVILRGMVTIVVWTSQTC